MPNPVMLYATAGVAPDLQKTQVIISDTTVLQIDLQLIEKT